VDELGLKNLRVGNARVSEVHGNFIVNDGGATATEMLDLIDHIKQTAKTKRGIELETEVQIVGEPRNEEKDLPKKIAVLMGGPVPSATFRLRRVAEFQKLALVGRRRR
jgi:hypothetical protein